MERLALWLRCEQPTLLLPLPSFPHQQQCVDKNRLLHLEQLAYSTQQAMTKKCVSHIRRQIALKTFGSSQIDLALNE